MSSQPLPRGLSTTLVQREELAEKGQPSSSGSRRTSVRGSAERRDYEASLQLSRELDALDAAAHADAMRKSKLPSLLKVMPADLKPLVSGSIADAGVSAEAGPSRPSFTVHAPPPSRKGKERAVEVSEDAPVEAKQEAKRKTKAKLAPPRRNPVGVQLLSEHMHSQLFPGEPLPKVPDSLLAISKDHLQMHGLSPEGAAVLPQISFDMPALEGGGNIRQHFHALGKHAAEPYLSMAKEFVELDLPPMPQQWVVDRPGWTRYASDGSTSVVDSLDGETIVSFDVETLWKISPYAVMATAASKDAWYSWLSPSVFEDPPTTVASTPSKPLWDKTTPETCPRTLIPLFKDGNKPTIAIGHNVGYDRQRVAEEYCLEGTQTRWLDTLSLHVATRGITSVQRAAWMKYRKNKVAKAEQQVETAEVLQEEAERNGDDLLAQSLAEWNNGADEEAGAVKTWEEVTSANSLADVAALHCGMKVDKSVRDRFSDDSIKHASELRPELAELLTYCATDVVTTHKVYKEVLPLFLNSCPHPVSFSGMLTMGSAFLPVDEQWKEYLRNAETKYQELNEGVRQALRHLADNVRLAGPKDDDPWISQLDWTPKPARWAEDSGAVAESAPVAKTKATKPSSAASQPRWYTAIAKPSDLATNHSQRYLLPLLMRMSFRGYPVYYLQDHYWCFKAPLEAVADLVPIHGEPIELSSKDAALEPLLDDAVFFRVPLLSEARRTKLVGKAVRKDVGNGLLTSPYPDLLRRLTSAGPEAVVDQLMACATDMLKDGRETEWGAQLDWTIDSSSAASTPATPKLSLKRAPYGTWPKWYWDLTVAPTNNKVPQGELDLSTRKSVSPLLLRMQWQGYPLAISKEHKWLFRVPVSETSSDPESPVSVLKAVTLNGLKGDEHLVSDKNHLYFKIPHKDGEGANVGTPLSKAFLKATENGILTSGLASDPDPEVANAASAAMNMNALCSYWISSRERIMDQFVVYRDPSRGMILPPVITMGTVTRRAVEATWLTASNAKKNRVGSELKAMVRAPPGYAIVGADVDSEELWISSVMGDSQFGTHGATAIGWMTLEGTKSAGTDLHSKTANILNISRDGAKVFNYSRIYGAGKPHAIQLLLQGDGTLSKEEADTLATNLYKQTKGAKAFGGRKGQPGKTSYLWHGGSESYLFNTLESIALMDRPTTPALGCGVTRALRKSFLDAGHSYLPSRINWVVQSSGVDYLHLLIVSMDYLIKKYGIKVRYLISVHDEVRYLAEEDDKYRAALALQIANAWTRALFCFNLGLDDMPQGVAFFSAVDVDHILRKETDMTCVTPSHPASLACGESLDINTVLERTGGGELGPAIDTPPLERVPDPGPPVSIFGDIQSPAHARFLSAQASTNGAGARGWLAKQAPAGDVTGGGGEGDGGGGAVFAPAPKKRAPRMPKAEAQRATQLHDDDVPFDAYEARGYAPSSASYAWSDDDLSEALRSISIGGGDRKVRW
ncbi:DNA-directed DNA polymerase gamma mip1 [Vanrija albida]|uniref:Mitochondrial DNA polymerase catalytic subunit n=1 Tax=Vanrija albida TaxID=181172 RepID=A0ABR3PYN6_9TREE